ncbi:hypothetical protein R1flu_004244 [Riccia fluitans]|uniref:Protein kinase domain-containing protein n=1 Tax=Riccia fluitans TaxID=41844 RepID=A0ABD1YPR4_9MARC
MAFWAVKQIDQCEQESIRSGCFCLPEFRSSKKKSTKDSESNTKLLTSISSEKSSTGSVSKVTGTESDSWDSNSKKQLRSTENDVQSNRSLLMSSCLRVPKTGEREAETISVSTRNLRRFSYKELEIATNCFDKSKLVSHPSFKLYRGTLATGETVYVRRLSGVSDNRFRKAVESQSQLEHENLLCISGFADDQGEQILVSEPAYHGTLADHLHDISGCSLPWNSRISIAIGIARAVTYLLWRQNPPIIHQDLRPQNIFLGDNFVPKVANYSSPYQYSDMYVKVRSWEYYDPESLSQEQTETCNVYSFGVILLQLLTGKPTHDPRTKENLVNRAMRYQNKVQDGNFEAVRLKLDPFIIEESVVQLEACWNLALRCVGKNHDERPTMEEIVESLEDFQEHG